MERAVKELTDKWRERGQGNCATDLENYLASLWTTISDDPESLPEVGRHIAFWEDEYDSCAFTWDLQDRQIWDKGAYRGYRWRYFGKGGGIAGCDYPMEVE